MPDRYFTQDDSYQTLPGSWQQSQSSFEREMMLRQKMLAEQAQRAMERRMADEAYFRYDLSMDVMRPVVMNVEYNQTNFGHGGRKKESGMNLSTAIFLINKNARAIKANYDPDMPERKPSYNAVFKTLDPDIKVDDMVVVPTKTRHGFTVVKVTEADFDIDLDTTEEIAWVVQKVDKDEFDSRLEQEATAMKTIRSAEIRKKREDLAKSILADTMETIQALPISTMGDAK